MTTGIFAPEESMVRMVRVFITKNAPLEQYQIDHLYRLTGVDVKAETCTNCHAKPVEESARCYGLCKACFNVQADMVDNEKNWPAETEE